MTPTEFNPPVLPEWALAEMYRRQIESVGASRSVLVSSGCSMCDNWAWRYLLDGMAHDQLPQGSTVWDVLVVAGLFSSRSKARKEWRGPQEFPVGLTMWRVGNPRVLLVIAAPKGCVQDAHEVWR